MATPFNRTRTPTALVTPDEERSRLVSPGRNGHLPPPKHQRNAANGALPIKNVDGGVPARRSLAWPARAITAASASLRDMVDSRILRLAKPKSKRLDSSPDRARQILAWDMYDQVGELREATRLIADAVASADLYVGKVVPGDQQPERTRKTGVADDGPAILMPKAATAVDELLRSLVASGALERMATQMFVGAETFLLGVPDDLDTAEVNDRGITLAEAALGDGIYRLSPEASNTELDPATPVDDGLVWHALSFDEVRLAGDPGEDGKERKDEDTMEVLLDGEWHTLLVDRVVGVAIWQAHPRRSDRLDSGVLSALPILLQLVAIGQYAQAAVDSRLAGPGVFVIPHSALNINPGADREEVATALNSFMADLTEAMITPIEDRSSPSAVVPITVAVADEATGKFHRVTFEVDLGSEVDDREEHLIRRLARALDIPVEQMLGMGDSNHWSAWQVDDATVKAHVEPMLSVIVTELTKAILWPTLEDAGMPPLEVRKWAIGHDTSNLILRPNRGAEAQALHDRGVLSDDALRRSAGFDSGDAPAVGDEWQGAVDMAMKLVLAAPALAQNPGLEALAVAIYSLGTEPPGLGQADPSEALEGIADADVGEGEPVPEEDDPEVRSDSPVPDTLGDPPQAAA